MEIKATLEKPYTDKERMDFIVLYNHNLGYEIKETETALEAWGETDEEQLTLAKQSKYQEANSGAFNYLQSGEALFPFIQNETTYHIEATDGNIAKIGLKATALLMAQDFETTFPWNTKEDLNIEINGLEGKAIAEGLGAVQNFVWVVQFPAYIKAIDDATTIEEVTAIEIRYTDELPEPEILSEQEQENEESN